MHQQFAMPDVGEGLTEAEIVGWRVSPGDAVRINQTLVEVETAKAVVELPSPHAGKVVRLHFSPGEVVPVGTPIVTIDDATEPGGEQATGLVMVPELLAREPEAGPSAGAPAAREAVLVGYGVSHTAVARRPRKPGWGPPHPGLPRPVALASRPYAKPLVRQLARRLGIDPARITPTGERGEVTRSDVLAASSASEVTAPAAKRIPVRGVRKRIAEAMVASAFTAPHVTEWVAVDVTRSLRLIDRLKSDQAWRGVRLTPLTVLARAVLLAVSRRPEINARWDGDASEIVEHRDVNLGVAVASPRGLLVPNIPAAQTFSFRSLADAMTELIETARANRTPPERMRDGTFTITNIGVFGIDGATPILNPGESAILAFGQIREIPWNHKGKVKLRSVSTLSLSFDHRIVDGELGSSVLVDIASFLEHPELALIT